MGREKELNQYKKNLEGTTNSLLSQVQSLRENIDKATKQDEAKETRFAKGAMISLMQSGDVRLKFESPEAAMKFFKEYE